jgi:hypothetical protein
MIFVLMVAIRLLGMYKFAGKTGKNCQKIVVIHLTKKKRMEERSPPSLP